MARPVLRNHTYYLRMRVPSDVSDQFGKTHVSVSLGTKDPQEARIRHAQELTRLQKNWSRLRDEKAGRFVSLSHKQVVALAGEHYRDLIANFEETPRLLR